MYLNIVELGLNEGIKKTYMASFVIGPLYNSYGVYGSTDSHICNLYLKYNRIIGIVYATLTLTIHNSKSISNASTYTIHINTNSYRTI